MSAADFLASIKAKFAEPEEYETALATFRDLQSRADRLSKALEIKHAAQERAEAERDEARPLLREAGEVVKPFADVAVFLDEHHPDAPAADEISGVSIGMTRRARAFLDKLGSNND